MNQLISSPSALTNHPKITVTPFRDLEFEDDPFSLKEALQKIGGVFKKKENPGANIGETSSSGSLSRSVNSGGFLNLLGGLATIAGSLVPVLPQIGIGSKSRIKESEAGANLQLSLIEAQERARNERAADQKQFLLIGGVFLLIVVVVIAVSRK